MSLIKLKKEEMESQVGLSHLSSVSPTLNWNDEIYCVYTLLYGFGLVYVKI